MTRKGGAVRTVVVNLVGGDALTGRRRLSWPWQIKLTGATLHPSGGPEARVDGYVIIPRSRIEWMQVVG